jgi:hypothetical protein
MHGETAVCYHGHLAVATVRYAMWPMARDRGRRLRDSRKSSPMSGCSSRPFARIVPIDVLRNRDMLWLALACPTRWRCQIVAVFANGPGWWPKHAASPLDPFAVLLGYSGKVESFYRRVDYGSSVYGRCGEERGSALMAWVVDIQ